MSKSLEIECNNLKELLSVSKSVQMDLATTCLIVIALFKAILKTNQDLKEQRKIFEAIYHKWYQTLSKMNIFGGKEICEQFLPKAKKETTNKCEEEHQRSNGKVDLFNAIDYSLSSSLFSSSSSSLIDAQLSATDIRNKRDTHQTDLRKQSRVGLFRKAVIAVLALKRLVYFHNQNRGLSLRIQIDEGFGIQLNLCDILDLSQGAQISHGNKNLRDLFVSMSKVKENQKIAKLAQVSNELNRLILNEESSKLVQHQFARFL